MPGHRVIFEALEHLEAIQAGHENVEQDQVGQLDGDCLEGGFAARGYLNGIAQARKTARQEFAVRLLIVHDQNRALPRALWWRLGFSRGPNQPPQPTPSLSPPRRLIPCPP